MLLSHRAVSMPEWGASLETRALVHSQYRLHLVTNTGVVVEDDLVLRAFTRKGAVSRPVLSVILSGHARIRTDEQQARWLDPGSVVVLPSKSAVSMRQEGPRFESIALEWDPGTLGSQPHYCTGKLDALMLRRITEIARQIRTDGTDTVDSTSGRFTELIRLLRSAGVPFVPAAPGDLIETVTPQSWSVSRILDRLLSRLTDRPMAIDLDQALRLSARQVTRVVTAFNKRYGFNSEGWRDTLNRRRLGIGTALMSAERSTTESVSSALGYSSATAFCRAMAEAALPAPGAVAAAVRNLR